MRKFSTDNPLQNPSKTPNDIVVRNLRRRLWAAIAHEDAASVMWLYKATRVDWEECLRLEAQFAGRDDSSKGMRKRLGSFRRNSKSRECSSPPGVEHDPTIQTSHDSEDETACSLLLQHFLPSEPFSEDDFCDPADPYPELNPDGKRVIRNHVLSAGGPRFAFGALLGRHAPEEPNTRQPKREGGLPLTSPIHECARMGNADLVRFLLKSATMSDPNTRNGDGQTALHCVAGGYTRLEEQHGPSPSPSALRVQQVDLSLQDEDAVAVQQAKRAVRAVGRLFRGHWAKEEAPKPETPSITLEEWRKLALDRMDTTLAILSWRNTDGDGQGISTNAVDDAGRTALHYAAELGRSDICQVLLSGPETFLTLVDQERQTPCDLADRSGNNKLAAHLEARAILYRDPYGMDDELLAQVIQNSGGEYDEEDAGAKLVSPFGWFTTHNMDQIQSERERRVQETLSLIQNVVDRRSEGEKKLEKLLGEPVETENPDLDILNFKRIHQGHVEMLLQKHGWDVKKAVVAFAKSPVRAFETCGIGVPSSPQLEEEEDAEVVCLICCDSFSKKSEEWKVLRSCSHGFCSSCLGSYIVDTANYCSDGLVVKCPHHACKSPLDPSEVSLYCRDREDFDRLAAASNNKFVLACETLRFCPHPDCSCTVKFTMPRFAKEAGLDHVDVFHLVGAVCARQGNSGQKFLSYEGVDDPQYFNHEVEPKKAHRFCFSCGEPHSHWPLKCDSLDEWKAEVADHVKEVAGGESNEEDFSGIAQKLWMKANTRPCPKCQVPIEKDQGCNHMTCSNAACHYEFCWICRNDWKLHSTATGGYFRCNRWQEKPEEHEYYDVPPDPDDIQVPTNEDLSDPNRMQVIYGTAMHESRVASKKSKEVGRFIHHYHRWSAHSQSRKLECTMSESTCKRLEPVTEAAKEIAGDPSFNFGGKGLSFLYAAFCELDECRSVLLHSYPFAYYRFADIDLRRHRYSKQYRSLAREKKQFEKLQSELELITENMSDIVARKHLRANESQIRFMTMTAAEKRKDFSNFLLTTLTEAKKAAERASNGERVGQRTSPTRIVGLTGSHGTNNEEDEMNDTATFMDDIFERSLEEFQVRMDSPDLSDIDSDGFGEQAAINYPPWSCPDCTFRNEERTVPFCEICNRARPDSED